MVIFLKCTFKIRKFYYQIQNY